MIPGRLHFKFNGSLIYNSDFERNGPLTFTRRKVGGPNDTLAPHLKKWGGQWPPGPPVSYATA